MTDEVSVTQAEDPEIIFLEPGCCVDWSGSGRQWCEHDVWGDDCENHSPPTEYVRSDITAKSARTTPAEHTLLTLIQLVREYLPSDGISKDEFINRVLGVLDNDEMAELVAEMEGRT